MAKKPCETVASFLPKGCNQGCNREKKVATVVNNNNNKHLQQLVKWIRRSEGCNHLGITRQGFEKHCRLGHFVTRKVKMNGGMGYEISLESVFKYYEKIGNWDMCQKALELTQKEGEKDAVLSSDLSSVEDTEKRAKTNLILTDQAAAKYQVCKLLETVFLYAEKKMPAVERWVNSFNQKSYPVLYDLLGSLSVRTVRRWYQAITDSGWDAAVFIKDIKQSQRAVSSREALIILPKLLNPNRPLTSEVLKNAKEELLKCGITLKSDMTYRRFIRDWTDRNIDLWTLARFGMKAYNDRILKDILRDKDRVEVGDVVVADGHTFNAMVVNPLTGRAQRMSLIMFYDYKSSMPLGWEIMPTENVQVIASALRRTIMLLGRFFGSKESAEGYVPRVAYLDNGRAFRSRYFRGVKDFRDSIVPGLFGKIGMDVMYAAPYHGQSKTIERWFRTLGELERRLPAYTGTGIADKPAMLMRNEKLHRVLFDNTPVSVSDLSANLELFIQEYAEQPHQDGQYKGLCPAEIFIHSVNSVLRENSQTEVCATGNKIKENSQTEVCATGNKIKEKENYKSRLIKPAELNYLMLSDESRKIGKNGIRFRGCYYWNEEMPRIIGSKVIVKYDIWDDSSIIVLSEKERYLFDAAKDDVRYHPAARLLGTDEDVALLANALAEKKRRKADAVQVFKAVTEIGRAQDTAAPQQMKISSKKEQKKQKLTGAQGGKNAFKKYMELIGAKPVYLNNEELIMKN